jgi:hypothetical protein
MPRWLGWRSFIISHRVILRTLKRRMFSRINTGQQLHESRRPFIGNIVGTTSVKRVQG